jgi:hypothetical protein
VTGLQVVLDDLQDQIDDLQPPPPPAAGTSEVLTLSTQRSSGTFSVTSQSSSGYYRVLWWDDSVTVHLTNTAATKSIPGAGTHDVRIWPGSLVDNLIVGTLTHFTSNNQTLNALDVGYCVNLNTLSLSNESVLTSITGLASHPTLASLSWTNSSGVTSIAATGITTLAALAVSNNTNLATLNCSGSYPLTSLTVNNLAACTTCNLANAQQTSLSLSSLPVCTSLSLNNAYLNTLSLDNVGITAFSVTGTAITALSLQNCASLTYLTLGTALQSFTLNNCDAYSGTVTLANSTALTFCAITNNALVSTAIISGCTNLFGCNIANNAALASVRAVGCVLKAGSVTTTVSNPTTYSTVTNVNTTVGTYLTNNNLNATALNQFYTDLASTPSLSTTTYTTIYDIGVIDVSSNPGTSGDSPSIATVKNYVIIGT